MPFLFRSFVSCLLLPSALLTASAQDDAPAPPRVLVEDSAPTEPLIPGGIEPSRRELATVPGGTDVVDLSATVRNGRVSTLKDALEFSPGVYVQPRFGAEESRLSIRGSGLQRTFHGRGLSLLLDGVPVNLADGGFDMQVIEPLAARYVEVWRGPNALQFGGVTLGGAINYVSPTGRDFPPVLLRLEAGSYGYLRGQVAGGYASGPFDAYLSLTHFSQDGFRDHARQDNQRLFLEPRLALESALGNAPLSYRRQDLFRAAGHAHAGAVRRRPDAGGPRQSRVGPGAQLPPRSHRAQEHVRFQRPLLRAVAVPLLQGSRPPDLPGR